MRTVSIIVPVYNRENTICRCIDSILAQSYVDYELIIVDDGSTDDTGRLCGEYAARYEFVQVIHSINKGPGAARNTGLERASGKLILFCDSDDTVEKDWVKKLIYPFHDERVVFSVSNYHRLKKGIDVDRIKQKDSMYFHIDEVTEVFEQYDLFNVWHCCYRKNQVRFPESYFYGEDTVYNLKYLLSYMGKSDYLGYFCGEHLYNHFTDTKNSLANIGRPTESLLTDELKLISEMMPHNGRIGDFSVRFQKHIQYELYCVNVIDAVRNLNFRVFKQQKSQPEWEILKESMRGGYSYPFYKSGSTILLCILHRYLVPLRRKHQNRQHG